MRKKRIRFFLFSIPSLLLLCLFGCDEFSGSDSEARNDWPVYLGGNSSSQFSSLNQINVDNIGQLEVAWAFSSGDANSDKKTQIQCNPIIIDGILYGTTPTLKIFALNAETGNKIWDFDPNPNAEQATNLNRGVTYWEDHEDTRIFFTAGAELFCLDAKTGEIIETFGTHGKVSIKAGLAEWAKDLFVVSTSPGIVYDDKIILGTRVSESAISAPGYIQAFNVQTGKLEWTFRTIPTPGEYGSETWPENAYKNIGGANAWAGMSLDEERGIVFVPTGSAAFDFYGGNRLGENLFANCVLALNAATGERLWHYQTVHHDLWDRDVPAPPNLVRIKHEGKMVDAVAQVSKSGFIFLLDRETGIPLFPVEERPVKVSDLKGEETWPTQPFPLKPPPFSRQEFTEKDITNISPEAHDYVSEILKKSRTGEQFIPPSEDGTVIFPGFDGGAGWGGAAFDAATGVLYINHKEEPCLLTMEATKTGETEDVDYGRAVYQSNCIMCHGKELQGDASGAYPSLTSVSQKYKTEEALQLINNGRGLMPGFEHLNDDEKAAVVNYLYGIENKTSDLHSLGMSSHKNVLPYRHTGYNRFFDEEGYPAIKPPWGILSAIDLNEGAIMWQVPLGEFKELTERGVPKTGTQNYGGPVVTAGGLVFIAATVDSYIRAFDKETGDELWKHELPACGFATPSVYQVNGKQYVVIACGGGKRGKKSGDTYLAFSLKD